MLWKIYARFAYLFSKLSVPHPSELTEAMEIWRLLSMPRFQRGESPLTGKRLRFVDSHTFAEGYREIFQKRIYDFVARNERPYIIDCGANIGLSVLFFKHLYPNATVLAFEPDPDIYEVCKYNISQYEHNSVQIEPYAVWVKEEDIVFEKEGGYSGRIAKPGDGQRPIAVKAVPLKRYLTHHVDFLKLDIEGAEADVLEDCAGELENIQNIFIEYHSHVSEIQRLDRLLAILTKAGFRYHISDSYSVTKPFIDRTTQLGMDFQLNISGYRLP